MKQKTTLTIVFTLAAIALQSCTTAHRKSAPVNNVSPAETESKPKEDTEEKRPRTSPLKFFKPRPGAHKPMLALTDEMRALPYMDL